MMLKLCLCILAVVLASSLAFGGRQFAAKYLETLFGYKSDIPDHVLYESIFRMKKSIRTKAEKKVKEGKPETGLKSYFKDKFELTDEEDERLDQVSDEYADAIRPVDARAKEITDEYRKNFPKGKMKEGEEPPPAELANLQARRNAIVMEHRDKLRAEIGDERFYSIDKKVNSDFAKNFRKLGDVTPARGNQ